MFIFYIVSCVLALLFVLSNLHFADKKLTWKQTICCVVASLTPVVNTVFVILVIVVAYKMAKAEVG